MSAARSDVISIGLVLAALPFTHLLDLGYSFLSFEVWAASVSFLLIGMALVYGASRLGQQSALAALSVFVFASVYFINTAMLSPLLLMVMFLLLWVLLRRIGPTVMPVAATFAVIFSLSNALVPQNDGFDVAGPDLAHTTQDGTPRNALLHIILDEQASLDAMAGTIPANHAALSIYDDYRQHGFDLYPTVRSVHHHTARSLPNLVSLTGDTENSELDEHGGPHVMLVKRNPQFARLAAHGYRLRVFQSAYLDFCADTSGIECNTYPIRDMSVFEAAGLSYGDRLMTAFIAMSRDYMNPQSGRYVGAYRATVSRLVSPDKSYRYLAWPLKSLDVIEHLHTELRNLKPGDAYFVHVLAPHFPYVLDAECALKPPGDWAYPLRQGRRQSRDEIELAYWDQAACTHKKIMQLLDVVADKPFTTVMIHGDHGARLYTETSGATEADSLDTFFSVRKPGIPHVEDASTPLLQHIFAEEFKDFLLGDTVSELTLH